MAARRIRGVAPKDTTRPDSEPVEMDATTTIRASVLRYVNDSMPGIRRRRCGCGFRYTGLNGTAITSAGGGGFLLLYAPPEKVRPARSMLRDCGLLPADAAEQIEQVEDAHLVVAYSLCVTIRARLRNEAKFYAIQSAGGGIIAVMVTWDRIAPAVPAIAGWGIVAVAGGLPPVWVRYVSARMAPHQPASVARAGYDGRSWGLAHSWHISCASYRGGCGTARPHTGGMAIGQ
ncbi:MAG TPA: hypothetical protein VFU63_09820 [Ktedonobacterales bacterium]|nr:hypothetical protein [Ktedonobacterales bacterium]